jgi:hypothetical protein
MGDSGVNMRIILISILKKKGYENVRLFQRIQDHVWSSG